MKPTVLGLKLVAEILERPVERQLAIEKLPALLPVAKTAASALLEEANLLMRGASLSNVGFKARQMKEVANPELTKSAQLFPEWSMLSQFKPTHIAHARGKEVDSWLFLSTKPGANSINQAALYRNNIVNGDQYIIKSGLPNRGLELTKADRFSSGLSDKSLKTDPVLKSIYKPEAASGAHHASWKEAPSASMTKRPTLDDYDRITEPRVYAAWLRTLGLR